MDPASPADLYDRALAIARRAHAGQFDKGGHPYIDHPIRVAGRFQDPHAKAVAVLHDVLEDSEITASDLLAEGIPPDVVGDVMILTRREDETYEAFIERIGSTHSRAGRVKVADLEDNLNDARLPRPLTDRDRRRLAKYSQARRRLFKNAGIERVAKERQQRELRRPGYPQAAVRGPAWIRAVERTPDSIGAVVLVVGIGLWLIVWIWVDHLAFPSAFAVAAMWLYGRSRRWRTILRPATTPASPPPVKEFAPRAFIEWATYADARGVQYAELGGRIYRLDKDPYDLFTPLDVWDGTAWVPSPDRTPVDFTSMGDTEFVSLEKLAELGIQTWGEPVSPPCYAQIDGRVYRVPQNLRRAAAPADVWSGTSWEQSDIPLSYFTADNVEWLSFEELGRRGISR